MIRLRRMLERGCAHPLLGPLLLALLVLLLAMVLVHAAHDGLDAATEVGAICVALASFFGVAVLEGLVRPPRDARSSSPGDRGPPPVLCSAFVRTTVAVGAFTGPLRR